MRAGFDYPVHWKELNGETDVFDDGRVVLFPTPGIRQASNRCSSVWIT